MKVVLKIIYQRKKMKTKILFHQLLNRHKGKLFEKDETNRQQKKKQKLNEAVTNPKRNPDHKPNQQSSTKQNVTELNLEENEA